MAALVHMTDEDLKAIGIPMVSIIILYEDSFEDCDLLFFIFLLIFWL